MKVKSESTQYLKTPLWWILALLIFAVFLSGCSDDDDNGAEPQLQSIVETIYSQARFSYLAQALAGSGYADSLEVEGPYTVFAPVNSAFEALGSEGINSLLNQSNQALQEVLKYHVVSGNIRESDLINQSTVETIQGDEITITVEGDSVFLNDSIKVLESDILATDGVIHAVGGILTP